MPRRSVRRKSSRKPMKKRKSLRKRKMRKRKTKRRKSRKGKSRRRRARKFRMMGGGRPPTEKEKEEYLRLYHWKENVPDDLMQDITPFYKEDRAFCLAMGIPPYICLNGPANETEINYWMKIRDGSLPDDLSRDDLNKNIAPFYQKDKRFCLAMSVDYDTCESLVKDENYKDIDTWLKENGLLK